VNHISALNTGIITLSGKPAANAAANAKKTIIVTGLARSGTTMVATVARAAGVFMGQFFHEVVQEDAQALELITSQNTGRLKTFIETRNAEYRRWGFKVPNLHMYLSYRDLSLFRNPHLIVIYRDPVAVAVRGALSEHRYAINELMGATGSMYSLAQFIDRADCPTLMLSYEKALTFPEATIESIMEFCGIKVTPGAREKLLKKIQPNRPEYLAGATRQFAGTIDGILDGQLYGWARQVGMIAPIDVDLYIDDQLAGTVTADRFRTDLLENGIGNGNHGFFISLGRYNIAPDSVIRVKVNKRTFELNNSGRTFDQYAVHVNA